MQSMTGMAPPRDGHGKRWVFLLSAWMIALAATLGALFIGEILGQAPCQLCWYQRIFMFPLGIILGVAAYCSDLRISRYALPLAALGGLTALYHSLLYLKVIPERIEQCGVGPSCSNADMTILGGIPLPLLSLAAFTAIAVLLLVSSRRSDP